jgi:hypothetical protein
MVIYRYRYRSLFVISIGPFDTGYAVLWSVFALCLFFEIPVPYLAAIPIRNISTGTTLQLP